MTTYEGEFTIYTDPQHEAAAVKAVVERQETEETITVKGGEE